MSNHWVNESVNVGFGGTAEAMASAEGLARSGEWVAALRQLNGLLASDPNHLAALELKARCEWKQGEHVPLAATLRRLIAINPYEPGYHLLLGASLQAVGRYGAAARALARAHGAHGQQEALSDLQSWQSGLVQELLQLDPVFRAHFRQNPRQACAERGFQLAIEQENPPLIAPSQRASLYTRPS